MKWVYLLTAIGLEVAGTTAMKLSDGLSRLVPSILMFVFYFSCFGVFAFEFFEGDIHSADCGGGYRFEFQRRQSLRRGQGEENEKGIDSLFFRYGKHQACRGYCEE